MIEAGMTARDRGTGLPGLSSFGFDRTRKHAGDEQEQQAGKTETHNQNFQKSRQRSGMTTANQLAPFLSKA